MQEKNKLSFQSALLWILISSLLITGSAVGGFFYYRHVKRQRWHQPQYNIVAILQTTPDKERLKTIYLAELLKLSVDRPTNLFRFNTKEAKRVLLNSPLITSAKVKKIPPGILYIDYSLRKPIAVLVDFTNTAVDQEGVSFPFKPFFTPKKLPEIHLGLQAPLVWGQPIQDIKCKLALYLIDLVHANCCKNGLQLLRVDVSNALADSYGQRQIIIFLEDHRIKKELSGKVHESVIPHLLRLSVDNYRQELANYLELRSVLYSEKFKKFTEKGAEPIVIDLRIPELAFIKQ